MSETEEDPTIARARLLEIDKPRPVKRMSLANIVTGKQNVPDRILLYGVEGIGKSSWAMKAPAPIFITPDHDGTAKLDIARMPNPESWADILDAVRELVSSPHDFKTMVLDTLDAAEAMLWAHICKRDEKDSIEAYGYGKGYVAALDEWRVFVAHLEKMRRERSMGVILIAHSWIKAFKNPEGEDFDRYELKLHAKASGLLKEWCDAVLFANYETFAVKEDDKKGVRAKGVSSGARILHTQRTAAWDAKNRYSLPEALPLQYEDFASAVQSRQTAPPDEIRASIAAKLTEIADDKVTAAVTQDIEKAGNDAEALAKIDNRVAATLRKRKGVQK